MMFRNPQSPRWKAAGIGLLISLATLLFTQNDLFEALELKLYDFGFHLRGSHPAGPYVVIADIDDFTVSQFGDPPWPRFRFAELIDRLNRAGARVIAFDLRMSGPDPKSPAGDQALAEAMSRSGNVVLPVVFPRAIKAHVKPVPVTSHCEYAFRPARVLNEVNQIALPYAPLLQHAAGLGQINIYPERDGIVRKTPLTVDYQRHPFPSLALEVVRVFIGSRSIIRVEPGEEVAVEGIRIPIDSGFEMMLNFAGGYQTFPYYSVANILSGKTNPGVFKDKIVLLGATAAQQASLYPTPVTQLYPGVEIEATAIDNILENRPMRPAPRIANVVLLLFIGPTLGLILAYQRPLFSSVYALTIGACIAFTVFYFFAARLIWMDIVRPLTALFWTYLAVLIYRLRLGEQEAARTRSIIDTLMQVSTIIGSSLDQRRLLQLFIEWVTQMLSAEAGSILLFDESREKLLFEVATGEKSASVSQYSLKVGEGIAGWVAQHGESVIANDLQQDPRFQREISEAIDFPTYSIVCVPLRTKDEILGVIEVINKKDRSGFADSDEEILLAIANQAGVVLENARLYSMLEERVDWANRELIQTNEELSVEKGKLEAIVRSMSEAVVVLDARGKLVFANPATCRVFDEEEVGALLGRHYEEVIVRPDLLKELQAVYDSPAEREVREFKVEEPRYRVFSAHLAPLRGPQNEMLGVVIVFSDITELKELDRAKSDFVSFVSHEMRTPITTIKGFALTMLRAELTDEKAREDFLKIIAQECDRMSRLVSNILDLSRIEAGRALEMHLQDVALPQMLRRVVERNQLYATDHPISLSADPGLPVLRADADKLEQILINLVGNAIKYSPGGGDVGVRAWRSDSRVLISVEDHGIGIPKSKISKLFQRYQRVGGASAEKIVGTGLGLYLTRHLVLAHGGQIWVESVEGKGSTFYVSLPLKHEAEKQPPSEGMRAT